MKEFIYAFFLFLIFASTSCQDENNTSDFDPSDYSLLGKWEVEGRWHSSDYNNPIYYTDVIKDTIEFLINDPVNNPELTGVYLYINSNKYNSIYLEKTIDFFKPEFRFTERDFSPYRSGKFNFYGFERNFNDCGLNTLILFDKNIEENSYDYNSITILMSYCNERLTIKGKRL